MDSVRLICPHCGLRMEVMLQGKPASMMVFVCARCKEPLMRYAGEVFELDREEFKNLRKKLSPVISKLLQGGIVPTINDLFIEQLGAELNECRDVSEFINKI